jgi:hypothetical protein
MDDTRPGRDGPDARSAPEAARIEELLVGGRTPLRGRSGLAGSRFRVIAYLLLIAAFGAEENRTSAAGQKLPEICGGPVTRALAGGSIPRY